MVDPFRARPLVGHGHPDHGGYGDVVPITFPGRLVGVTLMVIGVISLSLVTATVASVFIERKFRQEKGLEAVKSTQHILILGWPEDAEALLEQLLKRLPLTIGVVLINKAPPEQMDAIKERYPKNAVFYLRGDYSREEILLKANVQGAIKAIILADRQPGETGRPGGSTDFVHRPHLEGPTSQNSHHGGVAAAGKPHLPGARRGRGGVDPGTIRQLAPGGAITSRPCSASTPHC